MHCGSRCIGLLRDRRFAQSSFLLVASANVLLWEKQASSAESADKSKKDEATKESCDLAKKWGSLDGRDFFNRLILSTEDEPDIENADDRELSLKEIVESVLFGRKSSENSESPALTNEQDSNDFFSMAKTFAQLSFGDSATQEKSIQELVLQARESTSRGDFSESQGFCDILSCLKSNVDAVTTSLEKSFGHLDLTALSPTSVFYYLEAEDERKNPSWIRRMHRFHRGIDIEQVTHLNDMLYLSDLSYADTIEEIVDGCRQAADPLELFYCDLNSTPAKPGHFIAVKKNQSIWSPYLEVVFVVRGTKTLADVMTDCVVDAVPYRGGKAHSGILNSGKWLVSEHKELLEKLRKLARKRGIKLTLVGHSLGAGAASIAGIEFHHLNKFKVNVIGFGCPSLLSLELSKKYESLITSVIADSDMVPRMSGASLANLLLDIVEYDWTPYARRDIAHALAEAQAAYPYLLSQASSESLMTLVDSLLDSYVKPFISKPSGRRVTPELCPPGTCVHLYRDGSGIAGCIAPCSFFQEIDVTRRMLDDHKISSGYKKCFLELMRQYTNDHNFRFNEDNLGMKQISAQPGEE